MGGSDFEDKSTNAMHATEFGGVEPAQVGILNYAVNLDGSGTKHIDVGGATLSATNYSVSIWFNTREESGVAQALFHTGVTGNCNPSSQTISIKDGLLKSKIGCVTKAVGRFEVPITTNTWHHIVFVRESQILAKLFLNGKLIDQGNDNASIAVGYPIPIALSYGNELVGNWHNGNNNNGPFNGLIDEVATWSRSLTATEVKELYQRGANRIKYQVKSCVDPACFCTSLNLGVGGIASDCDGDGTPNSVDFSDTFVSQWLGRDGPTGASFSELQNCLTIDGVTTGRCMGITNSTAPVYNFLNYPNLAQPVANRYFQYRILMEAEENLACSGGTAPCMPEVSTVTVGPTGRYFGGSPALESKNPIPYISISNLAFYESNCQMTYQLSADGTTYRYWNGNTWAVAIGPNLSESALANVTTENIAAFVEQVGPGNLFWRAFITSDTTQACQLDKVTVSVFN